MHVFRSMPLALCTSLLATGLPSHANEAPDYTGAQLFGVFYASCHGEQAGGNGPMAKSLTIKSTDLTRIGRRHDGEFPAELVTRIIDGREPPPTHHQHDMPAWGQEFYGKNDNDPARRARSNELIDGLVGYLRSIQR